MGMGTGTLIIVPTQALCEDVASKLPNTYARHLLTFNGGYCYENGVRLDADKINITCCPEGIRPLYNSDAFIPNNILIDEAGQVASILIRSKTMSEGHASRREALIALVQFFKNASKIIIQEHRLAQHPTAIELFEDLSNCKVGYLLVNTFKQERNHPMTVFNSADEIEEAVSKLLGEGKRLLVSCDYKEETKFIQKALERTGKNGLVINADEKCNPDSEQSIKDFMKNPTDWLMKHPDHSLVVSPSVQSGISIESPVHFDYVVGIYKGWAMNADTACQQLSRYRPGAPMLLYAVDKLNVDTHLRQTSPVKLRKEILSGKSQSRDINKAKFASVIADFCDINSNEGSTLLNCYCELAAHEYRQSHSFKADILRGMQNNGYVLQGPLKSDHAAGKEDTNIAKSKRRGEKAMKPTEVFAARVIDEEEFSELSAKNNISNTDRLAKERYRISKAMYIAPEQLTLTDVEFYLKRKGDIYARRDFVDYQNGIAPSQRKQWQMLEEVHLTGDERRQNGLFTLESCEVFQLAHLDAVYKGSDAVVQSINEAMVNCADDIKRYCGFPVEVDNATKNIGNALKWLGFNTKRVGKPNTDNRRYCLDTPENRTIQEIVEFHVKRHSKPEDSVTRLPDHRNVMEIYGNLMLQV